MYIITSYYGKEVSQPLVFTDRNEAYKVWALDILNVAYQFDVINDSTFHKAKDTIYWEMTDADEIQELLENLFEDKNCYRVTNGYAFCDVYYDYVVQIFCVTKNIES